MKRLTPTDRKVAILVAAIEVAKMGSYRYITRARVATQAGVSAPLVTHYFNTMETLRTKLMVYAVATGDAEIVAQGLMAGDKIAQSAPEALKTKAREVSKW